MTAFFRYILAWLPSGDSRQLLKCNHPHITVFCSLCIWAVGATRLQAETEEVLSITTLENSNLSSELLQPINSGAALDKPVTQSRPIMSPVVVSESSSAELPLPNNSETSIELPKPITLVINPENPHAKLIAPSNSIAELSSSPAEFISVSSASELLVEPKKEVKNYAHRVTDRQLVESLIIPSSEDVSEFTEKTVTIVALNQLQIAPERKISTPWTQLPVQVKSQPFLIAAPENLNPNLRLPPPPPPPPPKVENPAASTEPKTPFAILEKIETDFRNDQDNFGQKNQFIEPTAFFKLRNGNRIRLKTGLDTFSQPGFNSVANIPFQLGWQGKVGQFDVLAAGGVDLFDRLPTALNLDTKVETQIFQKISLAGILQQGPYKFNAQTLDNQITAWRYGTNFYWPIDRYTSLFSLFRLGNYNDGNSEQQSFSRLERKFGQFAIAANLFNWSYQHDYEKRSGYFSPPDFLVYNAEASWQGDIFNFLRCRVSSNLGKQRLLGKVDNANNYQALCTVKVSPKIEADVGYSYSNLKNRGEGGGSAYNNRSITGQLRWNF